MLNSQIAAIWVIEPQRTSASANFVPTGNQYVKPNSDNCHRYLTPHDILRQ